MLWVAFGITLDGGGALAGDCSMLRSGLYDTNAAQSDMELAASFRHLLCQQNLHNSSDVRNFGLSLGIQYVDLSGSLGLNNNQNEWQQSFTAFCDDQIYNRSFKQRAETLVRRVNAQVVDALKVCLTQKGVHAWIEQGDRSFLFFMQYNSSSSNDPFVPRVGYLKVTEMMPTGQRPDPDLSQPSADGAPGPTLLPPSSSDTGRSHVGHHHRASIDVPHTECRGAAAPSVISPTSFRQTPSCACAPATFGWS